MERGLKERLVGAAVLVVLAVVFIPMLLDDSSTEHGPPSGSNIPERPTGEDGFSSRIIPVEPEPVDVVPPRPVPRIPELETPTETGMEEQAPTGPDAATDSQTRSDSPAESDMQTDPGPEAKSSVEPEAAQPPPAEPEPRQPAQTEPKPAAKAGQPSGYVVQLASFAQENNARDLDKKLRQAGYGSFVETVQQSGKIVYRVRVGPEVKRSEAEKLRDRISAKFELKGMIVSYP